MILITHGHQDHTAVNLIKNRNDSCQVITWEEALVNGEYKTFDLGFATVEAVQAGNNKNHNIRECVGWLITLSDGVTVYATGDTSTTDQMAELAGRHIDYGIIFWRPGLYELAARTDSGEAWSMVAEEIDGRYLFARPGMPVSAVTERLQEAEWIPPLATRAEPAFCTTFYEQEDSPGFVMMVLAFPALKMI